MSSPRLACVALIFLVPTLRVGTCFPDGQDGRDRPDSRRPSPPTPLPQAGEGSCSLGVPTLRVTAPPAALALNPFYKKYVSAGGLPVVGSEKVSDYAMLEAATIVNCMLAPRPDVRKALVKNKVLVAVMAHDELTTEIPEHSDLRPKDYWNRRARGLGATPKRPATSCGEENLLRYPGDPYRTESILVHEFAHTIHHMGLDSIDKDFSRKLEALYRKAMKRGLWKGKYAANNPAEYWAEGVQSFFDTNRPPDHDHNHVNTREELKEYDPELAALIAGEFRNTPWRFLRPDRRKEKGHLEGYDAAKAPRFAWPPELVKAYKKLQEEKKRKKKPARR